jgi:hypothetical protein
MDDSGHASTDTDKCCLTMIGGGRTCAASSLCRLNSSCRSSVAAIHPGVHAACKHMSTKMHCPTWAPICAGPAASRVCYETRCYPQMVQSADFRWSPRGDLDWCSLPGRSQHANKSVQVVAEGASHTRPNLRAGLGGLWSALEAFFPAQTRGGLSSSC